MKLNEVQNSYIKTVRKKNKINEEIESSVIDSINKTKYYLQNVFESVQKQEAPCEYLYQAEQALELSDEILNQLLEEQEEL